MLRALTTALRWLTVVLILRVLATILANYPDYFRHFSLMPTAIDLGADASPCGLES